MIDPLRLQQAYEVARRHLLAQRTPTGYWTGELSSSAFSTATAISALALVERHRSTDLGGKFVDPSHEARSSQLIVGGLRWLARHQLADGGWGDTDLNAANIATTMAARAAFHLTGVPCSQADVLDRAGSYIRKRGGVMALRRQYGKNPWLLAPLLTCNALAGLVSWREVPTLRCELAGWRMLSKRVDLDSLPILIAVGQAREHHRASWNPLVGSLRGRGFEQRLRVLASLQAESGSFNESIPLTSFVVMSLASMHRADHPIVWRGVEFLVASARNDGSWPLDSPLVNRNTSRATLALTAGRSFEPQLVAGLELLRSNQWETIHRTMSREAGGWGKADADGDPPNVADTAAALLALDRPLQAGQQPHEPASLNAGRKGIDWLLRRQHRDGGWPLQARRGKRRSMDRSSPELTAMALRALSVWQFRLSTAFSAGSLNRQRAGVEHDAEMIDSLRRGFEFLEREQRADGCWLPSWFGNPDQPNGENPVYGTASVVLAYRDALRIDAAAAQRGLAWLVEHQNADGGFGGRIERLPKGKTRAQSSIEETALAVEALLADTSLPRYQAAAEEGLDWLIEAVESGRLDEPMPLGFTYGGHWHYEKLGPCTSMVSALGQATLNAPPPHELKPVAIPADQA